MRRFTRRGLLLGLMNLLFLVGSIGCSTIQSERADIDARAKVALEELYAKTPAARGLAQDSAGVLVFPDVTQAGLMVGGSMGPACCSRTASPQDTTT